MITGNGTRIIYSGATGLSGVYVRRLQGVTLDATEISLSEVTGSGGIYTATMTGAAGQYILVVYNSADEKLGISDCIYWDGSAFYQWESASTILETIDKTGTKTIRRRD